MKEHTCAESKSCPAHGYDFSPRCGTCGRYMKWPEPLTIAEQIVRMNLPEAQLERYMEFIHEH